MYMEHHAESIETLPATTVCVCVCVCVCSLERVLKQRWMVRVADEVVETVFRRRGGR